MHGSSAGSPAPLTTFGGLVTLASPDSLPEGASPRLQDVDFLVGSVGTRAGLRSVYSFGESTIPRGGGQAVSSGRTITVPVPPPFPPPPGQSMAWAIAQLYGPPGTISIPPDIFNGDGVSGSSFANATDGGAAIIGGDPFLDPTLGISWSDFAMPPEIPSGATITAVYAVVQGTFQGQNAEAAVNYPGGSQAMGLTPFTGTTYSTILGTSLASIVVEAEAQCSAAGNSSTASVSFVALAVYYDDPANTTATTVFVPGPGAWTDPGNILLNDGLFSSTNASEGGDLDVTQFGFSVSPTISVTGATVTLYGYSDSNTQIDVQLLIGGLPVGQVKTLTMPTTPGPMVFGGTGDSWGAALSNAAVNGTGFGIRITVSSSFPLASVFLDYATIALGLTASAANFDFITTFVAQNGDVKNISMDADGDLWVEDVTNSPGIVALALTGITPNSFAVGVNGPDVEYLAFNDGFTGSDIPRQYTPNWIDKITQVGPGQAPIFSAVQASGNTYAISTISQPIAQTWTFAFGLQSTGPGSNTAGNVVTQYYSDSTLNPNPDTDLVTAFNSGNPVYVYLTITPSTGGDTVGSLQSPYVALVTSVGLGRPNGQSRNFWYFTYQVVGTAYVWNPGQQGYGVQYQRTLATINTAVPVPGLSVGEQVVISGNSVTEYDATWTISQTINSATMAITQSALDTSGVATYSYAVVSGANPTVGQLVTIIGTLNANGVLNVTNAPIATVTGTNTGSFTVNLLAGGTTFAAVAEQGQAITAGTQFAFDPGVTDLGTGTSPIFGNGTGGTLTVTGTGQFIAPGTKQGTVFFITRNGAWTFPAPPVIFDIPNNTTAIQATQIPIGPPNVIARGIIFTESGANGVPGGNFFFLDTPVDFTVLNVKYTTTALLVNDNISTSATFFFTDSVLLAGEAVDVQGNNLFNLIEIGNPGWIVKYNSRLFYGLCQNKIQNFNNLSFDGGYLPGGQTIPLGWTSPDIYGELLNSPVFGNSYYIQNTSSGTLATAGLISQTAYQDFYQQPIINANTAYSVRVTARIPSGNTTGSLVVQLTAGGIVYGTYTLPFASMTTTMAIYSGTLLTTEFDTVPSGLTLSVFASGIGAGADVELDRIEPFDTAIPILATTVFGSYANLPESVDAVDGAVQFISENQQPVNGAVVMYDTFYGLKESSMYSLQAIPNLEPAQWGEPEVAQRAGACGINAYDFGEQWIVEACRNGIYLYEGGLPGKITQEIFQVWNSLNWKAKQCIWVRNDVKNRRLFIGVPMPTPNFWLPNAPVNSNPTTPNVILMCNYQGIESGEGLKAESQIHVTMFGTLEAGDMRRKWSIWNIPSPYAAFVKTATDEAFYICNGQDNSKIYSLDETMTTDDGTAINSLYTTYGFVDTQKATQLPMLGNFRKRWKYMTMTASGAGNFAVKFLPNQILGPTDSTTGYRSWTVPGGFNLQPVCLNDREASLNFVATRSYVELSTSGNFELSGLTLKGTKDVWNEFTGIK